MRKRNRYKILVWSWGGFLASLLAFSLLVCSCSKIEQTDRIEPGIFYDSWEAKGRIVEATCTIGNYLEGESHVLIEITNTVKDSTACCPIYKTSREFRKELRNLHEQEHSNLPFKFFRNAKGVEITWEMFDKIYSRYASN